MRSALAVVGLILLLSAESPAQEAGFHFTVTADMRGKHPNFTRVVQAIRDHPGGVGAFHVTAGDLDDRAWENRTVIDQVLGPHVLWFPAIGNHEAEDETEMEWLRTEYLEGEGHRPPLRLATRQDGPPATLETTYSWDHGDAHMVVLNQYWDGDDEAGSDVATDGDVVPELLDWLEMNLAASTRSAVFVVGHEPAFPFFRHVGDSLDQYEDRRDAFWEVLEALGVVAYICGHTHVYSVHRPEGSPVWQIDAGNAGNDSEHKDHFTFIDVWVGAAQVRFDVWRDMGGLWQLAHTFTEPVPRVFLDGLETGDLERWHTE